jgi:hypothetical protein
MRQAQSARRNRVEKKHTTVASDREGWWVRVHHDDVRVVRASKAPDRPEEGEDRKILISGPFQTEEAASRIAEKLHSRTFKAMLEKGRK